MPYIKLDCEILDSSLWDWTPERHIFITALLMAKPHDLKSPEPQINVDNLEPTGWIVPPGKYGFVSASGAMIVKKALSISHMDRIEEDEDWKDAMSALAALGQPDNDSRSPHFDGRRLVRVNGGYIVLNFQRFRDKDHTAPERKRRQREREKSRRDGTERHVESRTVTQAEAESKADADDLDKDKDVPSGLPALYQNMTQEKFDELLLQWGYKALLNGQPRLFQQLKKRGWTIKGELIGNLRAALKPIEDEEQRKGNGETEQEETSLTTF